MKNLNNLKIINQIRSKFLIYNHPNYLKKLIELNPNIGKLKPAAVLIPLTFDSNSQISFTFTRRSQNLKLFKGECCFIGGNVDKKDQSALYTVYREANEEVGMNSQCLDILCHFKPIFTSHGYIVTPIVAFLNEDKFIPKINYQEVDLIFKVPTEIFLKKEIHYCSHLTYKKDKFFMHYFKWKHQDQNCLITGITSTLSILVSSIIHSQLPEFKFAPDINLELDKLNDYLDHLNLINGKAFIDDFNEKKI